MPRSCIVPAPAIHLFTQIYSLQSPHTVHPPIVYFRSTVFTVGRTVRNALKTADSYRARPADSKAFKGLRERCRIIRWPARRKLQPPFQAWEARAFPHAPYRLTRHGCSFRQASSEVFNQYAILQNGGNWLQASQSRRQISLTPGSFCIGSREDTIGFTRRARTSGCNITEDVEWRWGLLLEICHRKCSVGKGI